MITFETSSDDYDIIEKSGILECEGVTVTQETKEIEETKGKPSKIESILGPQQLAMSPLDVANLAVAVLTIIKSTIEIIEKIAPLIREFRKKRKKLTLKINGKALNFEGCDTDEEIKEMLLNALKEQG